ncbi:sigma-54-dependent Fis family transcriptional regulator [Sphingomonas phyllosphaerae]|uniref:sigma-54-dependent Fis family transcriptional regulator n=1 Tax=Sphingomonas phyllosphaerae TaxID=257003 RepID=UPI000423CCF7|nr:GAF domain-containing protein [Sphingomonas phyllosphaerae]
MDGAGVEQGRHAYFDEGRLPIERVRQPVLRSWLRCTDMGLVQGRLRGDGPLTDSELNALRQRRERLRRLCRPEMEMLAGEARETGSVVILADADGMILDSIGDTGFLSRAAQVALRPGVSWTEASTGTNAIGTAIAERRPIAVHGLEHFFAEHAVLSCAATPILDPRGAIVGALDISGPSANGHGHALGLIRLAVDQIEHRLFRDRFADCRVLRMHDDAAMLGTAREGILVFRDERLVAANRRGLSLVGRSWEALDDAALGELVDMREQASRGRLRLTSGTTLIGGWDAEGWGGGVELSVAARPLADERAQAIDAALAAHDGNVSAAARQLGVHRSTIHRHLARQC